MITGHRAATQRLNTLGLVAPVPMQNPGPAMPKWR